MSNDDDLTIEREEASSIVGSLGSACEVCKQRKVKCDRRQPSCSPCLRGRHTCQYRARKKPGLRAGYGRELEARLERLEGTLASQQHVIQQLAEYLPRLQQPETFRSESGRDFQSRPPASSNHTDSLVSSTTQHGTSAERDNGQMRSSPAIRFATFQQGHEPAIGVHEITSNAGVFHAPSTNLRDMPTTANMHHGYDDDLLLPVDLLYTLTELFFKHVNPWCPILHQRSIMESLFGSQILDKADRIILSAITATALKFSDDPRLDDDGRRRIHLAAKHTVLLYGLENASVKALQAMTILALDIVGDFNGPPGWNILALITRNVVQLGLAVEHTSSAFDYKAPSIYTLRAVMLPKPQNFLEDEMRRRLFWTIYLLDRFATIATAFDFAISDKEIERRLPCHDDLLDCVDFVETSWFRNVNGRNAQNVSVMQNVGSLGHYIELVDILSQTHSFLRTPIDISALVEVEEWQKQYLTLDGRLSSWRHALPSEYGSLSRLFNPGLYDKPIDCMWIMLQSIYFTTVIRLHSSAAYPAARTHIFQPSFRAGQRCLSAVDDICALCTFATTNNMLDRLGPPFAFSIWVAARVLLVAGSMANKLSPAITSLVSTLRTIGQFWNVADRHATLLQRVLDEYNESQSSLAASRETPSSVRIVADMRRCAFDLEYLISMQPRQRHGRETETLMTSGTPNTEELMSFDMFGFFNMPRLAMTHADPDGNGDRGVAMEGTTGMTQQATFNYQDLEADDWSDWLMQ